MSFGFGPLPGTSGGITAEDLASLLNPAALAGQAQAFAQPGNETSFLERRRMMREAEDRASQAGLLSGGALGAPMSLGPMPGAPMPEGAPSAPLEMRGIRPDTQAAQAPVMSRMPPLSLGPLPGAPAPAPAQIRAPVAQRVAGLVGSPLPPARPDDLAAPDEPVSQADMPAPDAVPAQGQVAAESGGGFGDAFGRFRDRGGFDLLGSIGAGLLSSPTWSGGVASGLQGYERSQVTKAGTDLAKAELALKQQKLAKEGRTQNATVQQIMRLNPGITQSDAEARAANPAYVTELMKGTLPPTEGYRQEKDEDGNTFSVNTRTGQKTLLLKSESTKPTLVDVPQADGSTIKTWITPGSSSGAQVGAPERSGSSNEAAKIKERRDGLVAAGEDPSTPRNRDYILTGRFPKEDSQALSAADKKAINAAEDELPVLDQTLSTLKRARELNGQTFTGAGAGFRGMIGSKLPDSLVPDFIADRPTAEKTREFGQIMTGEAINAMSQSLKGATTDTEMQRFIDILGDPSTPPEIRERTLDRMTLLAQRQKDLAESRINDMRGGTYYKPKPAGAAPAGGAPAPTTAPSGAPARPQSKSDYDALSSGAQYIAPDGSVRTKP